MRLFLDANVIFSAAHRVGGRAELLVELGRAGHCDLATSPHALEEARRNLVLKSSGFEERLAAALEIIELVSEARRENVHWALEQGLPAKDAPILAAAMQCGATHLVTGDAAHFGPLYGRTLRGVRVVAPAQALQALLASLGQ